MKKRFLCLILATIMLSSLFVGCDGAEVASAESQTASESVSANETESGYESNTNKKDETENGGDTATETDGGIGCELPTEADPFEGLEGEVTPEFVKAQMSFATRLFKESMAQRDKKENLLISPLSVMTALTMTANGAEGVTRGELEELFGMPVEELTESLREYMASLYNGDKAKLNIANSIWFRDSASLRLKDEFIAVNKDLLGADVYKRAFDSATVKELNAYVSDKTDGMIKELMQEIDPDMMVFLINALVFDAEWNEMFVDSAVRDGTFTSSDGVIRAVEMMSSEEYSYLRDEKAEGFIKHYAFGYSFVAMVPDAGVTLDDYISSLDYESLYGLVKSPSYRLVDAKMPKFKYEYSVDMKDTLKEMGLDHVFSAADFSSMAECDDGPLAVSQVVHKTAIELTEAGTKAAAVTQIIMRPESEPFGPPEEVYLDRPFFYMIIDNKSKLPIFMGAVTDLPDAEAVGNVASVEPVYSICQPTRWLDLYYDEALLEPFTVAKDGRKVILQIDSEEELALLTAAVYPENENAVLFSLPDGFFDESVLILCYLEEGSGSIKHTLRGCEIVAEAGKRTLRILADTYEPSVQTTDMAGWFIGVGIQRSDAEDCTEYSIEFRHHFLEEEEPEPIPGDGACVRIDFCGDGMELLSPMAEPTHLTDGRTIIRIDSMEELAAFTALLKENSFVLDFDEGVQSYNDLISRLDEAYFEEYSLIMAYVVEGSGSIRHKLKDSMLHHNGKIGKDTVILVVERIEPTEQTEDMAGWLICNAISKRYTETELYYEIQFE